MLSHDYVFWCGDFNYRINMCREDVITCVKNSDWETLLSADQLKIEHGNGNVFEDFNEGTIGTIEPKFFIISKSTNSISRKISLF